MTVASLTQTEIAALFSVTPRAVRGWSEEGIPRNPDGTYPGPAVVAWYCAREGGSSLDYTAERARLAKWQADKTEQDVEVRARRLLMADAVLQWVAGMVATVTARLVQIPDAVGHLVDPKYAPTVAAEVRRLIYEALEELSARGGPGALADLGDVEATADTDGEPVGGPVQKAVERKQRRARAVAN
jgi:hypothetical protein